MKRLRAARHPMTLCTPFKSLMGPMLVMGVRLLEHIVEEVGTSGGFPRVLALGGGDKVRVGGVAFRLRLLLAFLLSTVLS
jgi:hypothetical protein